MSTLQLRRKQTLGVIRQIFGKLRTLNATSTRVRRLFEERKQRRNNDSARYWERIRQYKAIMVSHGWDPANPLEIPQTLRELTPTSLQLQVTIPAPVDATTRESFVFKPPEIHLNFITENEANDIMAAEVRLYAFRNSVLRRAPKMEWFRSTQVRYSWGQHRSNDKYAQLFPTWMEGIAQDCQSQ